MRAKRRLHRVADLGIGIDGAATTDGDPFERVPGAPRTRGARRIPYQFARFAALQPQLSLRAEAKVRCIVAVEVGDRERHAEILSGYRHGHLPSGGPRHDERRTVRWRAPAEIRGHVDGADLPAAALTVVVRMRAPAIGTERARIVGIVPKLADVLHHHAHTVGVALAQVSAGGVIRTPPTQFDRPARHVRAALALRAEAIILELQHGREREGIVRAGNVDIFWPESGAAPQAW